MGGPSVQVLSLPSFLTELKPLWKEKRNTGMSSAFASLLSCPLFSGVPLVLQSFLLPLLPSKLPHPILLFLEATKGCIEGTQHETIADPAILFAFELGAVRPTE